MNDLDQLLEESTTGLTTRGTEVAASKATRTRANEKVKIKSSASGERRRKGTLLNAVQDSVLPDIGSVDPEIHVFWGSTTPEAKPSITSLLRNGCDYATQEDIDEDVTLYAIERQEGGSSMIRQNEMVLMKVSKKDWHDLLKELHHNEPARRQQDNMQIVASDPAYSGNFGGVTIDELEDEVGYRNEHGRNVKKRAPTNWDNLEKLPTIENFFE